ncbi:dNTP triphosphohydrolase [Halomonas desiderata]|uniref:dGTP triphosphohydrolase n=1 Tax=Billgrantia desiderata TaxID=52021 RepID=UPI00174AAF9C|nr:dNTP triphosphohydrolase [Halomonas desiderata]
MDTNSKWEKLLNQGRRKYDSRGDGHRENDTIPTRTEIERDYDRILFSTPVRRLGDKTQVFPLDNNDSVRNRLTHSHEVSNLARSIGVALVHKYSIAKDVPDACRNIPALLAAIGLVHDLGNPPFGHQGEAAIRSWFTDNREKLTKDQSNNEVIRKELYEDFLNFEGNAQGFRLVTRLQLLNDNFGLDLTYATLSAMMKYPIPVSKIDKKKGVSHKKFGYFFSEEKIAQQVFQKTGLLEGKRHPLAYLMEACDDIAYAVLDIEDAVKKGLASFSDLIAYLDHHANGDLLINELIKESEEKHQEYRTAELSPDELNDVSMQRFRVFAIGKMVQAVTLTFTDNLDTYISGTANQPILKSSEAEKLRQLLGDFSKIHAFQHRSVLEIELRGHNTIRSLMDCFWEAIRETDPDHPTKILSAPPFPRYVYTRISENYRRVYTDPALEIKQLPLRYRQLMLLTDMISGMTDSYAMSLLEEFNSFR